MWHWLILISMSYVEYAWVTVTISVFWKMSHQTTLKECSNRALRVKAVLWGKALTSAKLPKSTPHSKTVLRLASVCFVPDISRGGNWFWRSRGLLHSTVILAQEQHEVILVLSHMPYLHLNYPERSLSDLDIEPALMYFSWDNFSWEVGCIHDILA